MNEHELKDQIGYGTYKCFNQKKCPQYWKNCALSSNARELAYFINQPNFSELQYGEKLKKFYSDYLEEIKQRASDCFNRIKPLRRGDRKYLVKPFGNRLSELLECVTEGGIKQEYKISFETLTKPIDILIHGKKKIFIEIKYYLDFNHLGAALFESILCKQKYKNSKFFVVCWYDSGREKKRNQFNYGKIFEELPDSVKYIDGVFSLNPKYDKNKKLEEAINFLKEIKKHA
ncbi:MAG: hypothetical protein JRI77_13650 [Deltaproteobacteria bacterium]|nr:hypothetical protein [Deltaproteobacteria bacterium]